MSRHTNSGYGVLALRVLVRLFLSVLEYAAIPWPCEPGSRQLGGVVPHGLGCFPPAASVPVYQPA